MKNRNLNPEVKEIDIKRNGRYCNQRVVVSLDVSDGNGGREDLTVEYPIQDDKHLVMLLKDTEGKRSIDHQQTQELSDAIKAVIPKGD